MSAPQTPGPASEHFRAELLKRLRETSALVLRDYPPVLVAGRFAQALQAALGYCGAALADILGQKAVAIIRTEAGFCVRCDNPLPSADWRSPLCAECDRRLLEEFGDPERN